jgi:probable phosphoglycerate mutase
MHMDLFQRLEISPCSVSAIFFTPMGPRLLAYNDTGSLEHLKPKPEPKQAEAQQPQEDTAAPEGAPASAEAQPAAGDAAPPSVPAEVINGVEAPSA